MTDTENKSKSRAKLTLKLPTSTGTSGTVKSRSFDKKIGGSNVEVTIKGRKSAPVEKKEDNFIFDKKDFESLVVSQENNNSQSKKEEIKSHEILSKTLHC